MILFEICARNEAHPVYQQFEAANGARQYDFLRTLVEACLATGKPFLSAHIIKALNFQAITCLHTNAGEYRPCQVHVGNPADPATLYVPPADYLVDSYMDDFVNTTNREWEKADPLTLGAFVLWRLNHIHPFINGNGRSARAASYFVICLKLQGWLPGTTILPELLRQNRTEYVAVLKAADASYNAGSLDLAPLRNLIERLLIQQVSSATPPIAAAPQGAQGTPPANPP
ncbi:MAG TPA: Fic family protein [Aquabacterium sp.]|nr:Fic family protein [Aquabacterium sp.]HQC95738.1 Fic family protein [Aquabacterium sp.]